MNLKPPAALYGLLAASYGCTPSVTSSPSSQLPGASVAHPLISHTKALGAGWPLGIGALAAILAGVALVAFGNRPTGILLLGLGLILAVAPGWLLEIFHQVTWLGAASLAALLLMAVGYAGWRLFKLFKRRQDCNR